ncbi:predicted protein [Plenodomus lingam JN3]|uniref:Predicted protein n=1 Tax=Leptosphaeria maculans (strain JN3 / isolate v23.1.3 / race Av1-4-5-6-7-8) TaxID=985895 RepID=E4ZXQ1_LEPMJ|nr:predicted protein [Plenodomus lingam JN3]CBX96146.1 predicted protein [Plenodomus lingam JN3]
MHSHFNASRCDDVFAESTMVLNWGAFLPPCDNVTASRELNMTLANGHLLPHLLNYRQAALAGLQWPRNSPPFPPLTSPFSHSFHISVIVPHHSASDIQRAISSTPVSMPATTTQNSLQVPKSRLVGPRHWFQRQLRKTTSRQMLKPECQAPLPIQRPRTAPSVHTGTNASTSPSVQARLLSTKRTPFSTQVQPPLRPPRPEADVMRDINAWLEASTITPCPPLMGGLPYWRTATVPGIRDTNQVQHAIPIIREPDRRRPPTAQSQHIKPFRGRARKVHVQMPSMLRAGSQHLAVRKLDRRSTSMPVLAFSYEQMAQAAPPKLLSRPHSIRDSAIRPSTAHETAAIFDEPTENKTAQFGVPLSTLCGLKSNLDRRINTRFPWTSRSSDSTRPSTASGDRDQEDSMGDLSDAPTYFSGPPPPSYRSRAASPRRLGHVTGTELGKQVDQRVEIPTDHVHCTLREWRL